jgi:diphosphomevalonate decarboxylase
MSGLVLDGWVRAEANVNIALVKYWGKATAKHPLETNMPAVPSLSLTLDGLYTETWARFAPDRDRDAMTLDGVALEGAEAQRVGVVMARARALWGLAAPFEVVSRNHVPTAAGLASSASGMAALAVALGGLAGRDPSVPEEARELSELARLGSGSASRSLFGGWAAWDGPAARQIAPADHLDVAVVVAVVSAARKSVSSRDGMNHTRATSPYYGPWVAAAIETFRDAESALRARDLDTLFRAMRVSTWRMHASAMGANPPVCYWQPATLAALQVVDELRDSERLQVEATVDAGPNVKVFCRPSDADIVAQRLTSVPGVAKILRSGPGGGPRLGLAPHGPGPRNEEGHQESR